MVIKTLVENTSISADFGSEHGLSLYIETGGKRLLFDAGASELFLKNAQKLQVDISSVEYFILSHGHNDHGGGLETFFDENTSARVFVHPLAFGKYYAGARHTGGAPAYIGLDERLKENSQIVQTSDGLSIAEGIYVFSNVAQKQLRPLSNKDLLMERDGEMLQDTFAHEQNLVVEEGEKIFLITGCAHNGIVNILEHFYHWKGRMPDYVIGGFHLSSRVGSGESEETIAKIGEYLLDTKAKYYTGHCTGMDGYTRLKAVMGDRLSYLPAGSVLKI